MALFNDPSERLLMESYNSELYKLFCPDVEVYLTTSTNTYDNFYHEDVNRTRPLTPTYTCPAYINVTDNGMVALYKGGVQLERRLVVYFSRSLLEDKLRSLKLDIYDDIPDDGDVLKIQNVWFKIITVDPEGYHAVSRNYPYDYAVSVKVETPPAIAQPRYRQE